MTKQAIHKTESKPQGERLVFLTQQRSRRCFFWRRNFRTVNSTARSYPFSPASDARRCRKSRMRRTRRSRSANARSSGSTDGLPSIRDLSKNECWFGKGSRHGQRSSQKHHDSWLACPGREAALRANSATAFSRRMPWSWSATICVPTRSTRSRSQ